VLCPLLGRYFCPQWGGYQEEAEERIFRLGKVKNFGLELHWARQSPNSRQLGLGNGKPEAWFRADSC
jgi:hypothetical protein